MKNKNWTPVDAFVTEYGFRTNAEFIYQPGSGGATFKPRYGLDLDDLKRLIKTIEHHELQIAISGEVFVYVPEEEGEKPEAPEVEEPIEEPIEEPLVEEERPEEIAEAIEIDTEPETPEAIEEEVVELIPE